jgi:citrate synthase
MITDDKGTAEKVQNWWSTEIIDMRPGKIRIRGENIEDLIGKISFVQMIWLMIQGRMPEVKEACLMEAALVASVDHGPQAPAISTARMAVSCGNSLNHALASAVNMLGDVHGGAGEQCLELMQKVKDLLDKGGNLEASVAEEISKHLQTQGKFIPGFGHRFHRPEDPRAQRLMELVSKAEVEKIVSGSFLRIGLEIHRQLSRGKSTVIALNIDGATAVIFGELGFAPPLARGLFCLSRSVGILAHAWEQKNQGGRNKGPTPPEFLWNYTGKNPLKEE